MLDTIFTEGWELNMLLYGFIFLLGDYCVNRIIYRALIGSPRSFTYEDRRYWYRKADFLGAAVFAPLFEEIMFTYLAYASFLRYAHDGKQPVVIILVALFFALLHLPGDLNRMSYNLSPQKLYLLFKLQLDRFFYALSAYFIFQLTGLLWVTITLHYLFNAIVTFCMFEWEDDPYAFERGDGRLLLIRTLDLGFTLSATYFFYEQYPSFVIHLLPFAGFIFLNFLGVIVTEARAG